MSAVCSKAFEGHSNVEFWVKFCLPIHKKMQENLENTVEEFRVYSERASALFNETVQCLEEMETQAKLSKDAITDMFSSISMEEIKRALNKRPAVVFIGNRNCGKSAILNELLGGSYLPVHETPCTSRVVKISYTPSQNTVRVVDETGKETKPSTTFKKSVPKEYVVACDEGRDQSEQLRWTVEVALNHPFLKSGIELIDSPGKNENDALDDVVDAFFEKGTTPLVVYIIDGNEQLRSSDRDTIRFLQDKYPQLSFMFVCNKVDTSSGAGTYDNQSSDEVDSDEEESTTKQKQTKQRIVFSQLMDHGLIAENDSYETCSCFYGISARNAREDRRDKRSDSKATKAFRKFESGLLTVLDGTVKLQAKQVVSKLILLQMSIVQAMRKTRRDLPGTLFGSSLELDTAKSIGKSLHETLVSAIASKNKLGMLVNCNFLNLEEKFMLIAEQYQHRPKLRSPTTLELEARTFYLILLRENQDKDQLSFTPQKEDAPFLRFLVHMKEVILDLTFNVLKRVIEEFLKRTTEHVAFHSRRIDNPVLAYAFDVAYGSGVAKAQSSLPESNVDVLNLLKAMVSGALRKVLTELLFEGVRHAMTESRSSNNFNLADKQSRRKIMELIFSKFNREAITESLCTACSKCLKAVHDAFFKVIDDLSRVHDLVTTNTSHQLQEMAALYVPTVRHLLVQGLALQFLLTKGPLSLGAVVKKTKHGQLRELHESPGWVDGVCSGACVVKVIEEEKVEAEVWAQTSVDLFNTMEIQVRIGKPHRNLLYLHGWLTPEPGVVHVLMERAHSDVTTALQQGLSLKTRMKIALDVINGIKAVHTALYIHQDIKADSILLMGDGTAKINMAKPEKPFERTRQGTPFHISLEMHKNYGKGLGSDRSYDIYSFGILLWVLCEGSGTRRPQAYERYSTIAAMKLAVEKEIYPERPVGATDDCWELMTKCWRQRCVLTPDDVLKKMEDIFHCVQY